MPASVPHRPRDRPALAFRCRSSISTNSGSIAATASTASGSTIDAPSEVIVPETLMTRPQAELGADVDGHCQILCGLACRSVYSIPNGVSFAIIYLGAFSSEVDTGSREENA